MKLRIDHMGSGGYWVILNGKCVAKCATHGEAERMYWNIVNS